MTIYAKSHKDGVQGATWDVIDPLYVRGPDVDPTDGDTAWLQVARAWTKWDGVWRLVYPDTYCFYLSNTTNLNLAGWLLTKGAPAGKKICVFVPQGVTIGGTTHGIYALNVGNISIYESVELNIEGEVQGHGGQGAGGSSAIFSNYYITINISSTGAVRGGGGAGGRGGDGGSGWGTGWGEFKWNHRGEPEGSAYGEYNWRNPIRTDLGLIIYYESNATGEFGYVGRVSPYFDANATEYTMNGIKYKRGAQRTKLPAYKNLNNPDPNNTYHDQFDIRYEIAEEVTVNGVAGVGGGGGRGRGYNQSLANGANGTLGTNGAGDGGKGGTGGNWALGGAKGANGTAGNSGAGATGLNGFNGGQAMRLLGGSSVTNNGGTINGAVVGV